MIVDELDHLETRGMHVIIFLEMNGTAPMGYS